MWTSSSHLQKRCSSPLAIQAGLCLNLTPRCLLHLPLASGPEYPTATIAYVPRSNNNNVVLHTEEVLDFFHHALRYPQDRKLSSSVAPTCLYSEGGGSGHLYGTGFMPLSQGSTAAVRSERSWHCRHPAAPFHLLLYVLLFVQYG